MAEPVGPPLRICLVVPYDVSEEGGVKRHAVHLARALREAGDEVEIVGPRRGPAAEPGIHGFGGVVNIPANGAANYISLLLSPGKVADYFTRAAFDVVHVHEPMVPLLPWYAAWLPAQAARVATFHMYAETEGAVSRMGRGALAPLLYPWFDAAIAVSAAAAEYAAPFWRRPLPVVPNGVPCSTFRPPEHEPVAPGAPVRLLFVGNWRDPRKGLPVLLDALLGLPPETPAVTLDVIGLGEPSASQRAIPGVTFHGIVETEAALAEAYRRCDVFVAPSLGQESFGIVLLEAMASGRAIACSDIRGYRDLIGVEGAVLVPPSDPAALGRAIAALARSPERRREMGRRNRAAAESFDWTRVASEVRAVYLEALATRGRSRVPALAARS